MNYKLLIASGCSYTAKYSNWPEPLSDLLNCPHDNYGVPSVGNGRISRSAIYGVSQSLKQYKPEEILVGIVWSGSSRNEIYQSSVDIDNIYPTPDNPHGFVSDKKNWVTLSHHWKDHYSDTFYRNFYDQTSADIITLEHILRTQWFLEKNNINYFMSTFAPGVLPDKVDENTEHLLELIDFSKFLKVKSVMEWCIEDSNLPINESDKQYMNLGTINNMHPTPEMSEAFAERVIMPHLKNKGYVV